MSSRVGSAIGAKPNRGPAASVARMRRPSTVEVMLLVTIGLWSLNLTVSRYILTHGFLPLAYAAVRYGFAVVVFVVLTLALERSLRMRRADLGIVAAAAAIVYLNQIGFVYALERSSASVLGLILGATPIFAALAGLLLGTESLPPRFWAGAVCSFAGVALVALASGGAVTGDLGGVLLGVLTAATWAGYSILVTPLMRRYSATRISAVVLGAAWVPIALTALPQLSEQDWHLGPEVWTLFVFATLEPSIAAYHLALGPDGYLYVTGPTTSSFDTVHRISHVGEVEVLYRGLGRPQGMAFDAPGAGFGRRSASCWC